MAPRKKNDITPEAAKKPSNNKDLDKKIDKSSDDIVHNKTVHKEPRNSSIFIGTSNESLTKVDTLSENFEKLYKDIYNMRNDNNLSSNSILAAVNAGVINIKDCIKTNSNNSELENKVSSVLELEKSNSDKYIDIIDSIKEVNESMKEIDESLITKEDIDSSLQKVSDDISDKLVSQNQLQIENYNSIIELLNIVNCNNGGISQSVNELSNKLSTHMSNSFNNDMHLSKSVQDLAKCLLDINENIGKNMQSMETKLTNEVENKASLYLNKIKFYIGMAITVSAISALSSIIALCMMLFS